MNIYVWGAMAHAWGCIVIVIVKDIYIHALFPLPEDIEPQCRLTWSKMLNWGKIREIDWLAFFHFRQEL